MIEYTELEKLKIAVNNNLDRNPSKAGYTLLCVICILTIIYLFVKQTEFSKAEYIIITLSVMCAFFVIMMEHENTRIIKSLTSPGSYHHAIHDFPKTNNPEIDEIKCYFGIEETFIKNIILTGKSITEPEKIMAVAIKLPCGLIFGASRPFRHHHLIRCIGELYLNNEVASFVADQGFITTHGRYVHRIEARNIAEETGQMLPHVLKHTELYSENLWE